MARAAALLSKECAASGGCHIRRVAPPTDCRSGTTPVCPSFRPYRATTALVGATVPDISQFLRTGPAARTSGHRGGQPGGTGSSFPGTPVTGGYGGRPGRQAAHLPPGVCIRAVYTHLRYARTASRATTAPRYRPTQADRKDRLFAIKSVMTPVWGYTAHEPHGYLTGDYPNGGVVTGERAGLQELATRLVRFSLVAYTPRLREA